jgi:glycosyltransferase involved in cell wall biosynthesis
LLKVAIIIPCKNEERYISKCLDSVIAADYPEKLKQVFVCDGKSTDGTPGIIKGYCAKFPFIHLMMNENETTPYALNQGIENADADILVILGAHSEIYPDYIRQCVDCFNLTEGIGCVGGVTESIYESENAHVISIAMSSAFGVGNAYFRTGRKNGFVDTVAFGAYKKEVFKKTGMFDTDLTRNQDDEFNFRMLKAGFRIYLSEKIKSKYYVRGSFKKLFKQYFQYGFWKVYVNRKHKTITTYRQLAPFFLVLFLITGLFLSLLNPLILKVYFATLLFYLVLVFYFAVVNATKTRLIPGVALAFLILHTSYGTGYAYGIIYFLLSNQKPGKKFSDLSR